MDTLPRFPSRTTRTYLTTKGSSYIRFPWSATEINRPQPLEHLVQPWIMLLFLQHWELLPCKGTQSSLLGDLALGDRVYSNSIERPVRVKRAQQFGPIGSLPVVSSRCSSQNITALGKSWRCSMRSRPFRLWFVALGRRCTSALQLQELLGCGQQIL